MDRDQRFSGVPDEVGRGSSSALGEAAPHSAVGVVQWVVRLIRSSADPNNSASVAMFLGQGVVVSPA